MRPRGKGRKGVAGLAAPCYAKAMRRPTLNYLKTESGAGLILIGAAALAVMIANSHYAGRYFSFCAAPIAVRLGAFAETLSVADWVRTALMPVFFLVLGMQTKFELLRGELSNPRRLAMPAAAAVGGLVAPVGLYLLLNLGRGGLAAAWPVAGATDVSFALAVFALAGPSLPASLRVLLMSVALADDLAAVGLAGVFNHGAIQGRMLAGAVVALGALALLSRWRRAPFLFYAVGIVLVWGFVLKSGLDPSLAGIASAFTIPIGARRLGQDSVLKYFMDSLHPYVAFAVLPLFVFTAAGFSLRDIAPGDLRQPLVLGLAVALWVGKPLGVFLFAWAAAALRLARRPIGVAWTEILGIAMLSGAGLTVSLFLADLTLASPARGLAAVRLAVVGASALSSACGAALVARADERRRSGAGAAGDADLVLTAEN
jgi:NhaA family Na+:H+ antiporter